MKPGTRMYEYTDQNGVTYWSFTKHPITTTPALRLRLEDRIGTHFQNFLTEVRGLQQYLKQTSDDG